MKNLRKPSALWPLMLASMAIMPGTGRAQKTQVKSYKVEQKEEKGIQLSKQKLQRMKGKQTRKNRGKNRGGINGQNN